MNEFYSGKLLCVRPTLAALGQGGPVKEEGRFSVQMSKLPLSSRMRQLFHCANCSACRLTCHQLYSARQAAHTSSLFSLLVVFSLSLSPVSLTLNSVKQSLSNSRSQQSLSLSLSFFTLSSHSHSEVSLSRSSLSVFTICVLPPYTHPASLFFS